MSKYTFKRKDSAENTAESQTEGRIMNASASPEESTAIFKKSEVKKELQYNDIFLPFIDDEEEEHKKKKKKHKEKHKEKHEKHEKYDKHSDFSFNSFLNHKKQKDSNDESQDIVMKVEDIFKEDDLSVDKIKENIASGNKVDIAGIFSEKNEYPVTEDMELKNKLDSTKVSTPINAPALDSEEDDTPFVMPEFDESALNPAVVPRASSSPEEAASADAEEDTYDGLEDVELEENDTPSESHDFVEENEDSDSYEYESEPSSDDDDIYVDDDSIVVPKKEKVKKQRVEKEVREFKSLEERDEFCDIFMKRGQMSLISLAIAFLSALVLIYIETPSLPHPYWMTQGKFGLVYLMADLQFVLISAICILTPIIDGAKGLFTWRPNRNSIAFVSFVVTVIQIVLHTVHDKDSACTQLYSSVFAIIAVVTALTSYIEFRREYAAFKIVASSQVKNSVSTLSESSDEYNKFSEFLPEDALLHKIEKTRFIDGFFKTSSRPCPYNEMYKISIPLVLLASAIFGILSYTLTENATFCMALNNFTAAFMIALPVSSVFIVALPFFATSNKLAARNSAILGEAAVEEFANTSLVSFEDVDVFNPQGIKITSIKTYGKSRIDNTYLTAAKVFNLVGGPLKEVFNRSVIATSTDNSQDKILSVCETGINALVDGQNILLGTTEFIEANGHTHIDDTIDDEFTSKNGRIFYIVINGEISAKFYLKYALGRKFKALLDSFKDLGICMSISTRDPNLSTEFVTQLVNDDNYPIVVVKNTSVPQGADVEISDSLQSGIVSSSVPNMLRTFLAADKLSRAISLNTLAKYISLVFALAVLVIAFLADGSHEKITPMFIILYHIVWSLPVIGTSIINK
ncbi:MAG: hypothetical protein E7613_01970 [Ruminococcaceae bacterium]|nr:hypothetical protein [Oscillospiraceae bacterium]